MSVPGHRAPPAARSAPRSAARSGVVLSMPGNGEPRPHPTSKNPADISARWAITLVEPLLSVRRRIVAEDDMAALCRSKPAWATAFLGGVLADLVRSLPDDDPWRALSARIGTLSTGDSPPQQTGAVRADGRVFGTWHDAEDLVGLVFATPEIDVALAAVAEPLSPAAAAVLAISAAGWEAAARALRATHALAVPAEQDLPPEVSYPEQWRAGVSGRELYEVGTTALHWALFRRRSYGYTDDPWPVESCFRWGWRADQIVAGLDWPREEIEPTITAERVHPSDDF